MCVETVPSIPFGRGWLSPAVMQVVVCLVTGGWGQCAAEEIVIGSHLILGSEGFCCAGIGEGVKVKSPVHR